MPNFHDRIALVTGAGRGLGFAYAKLLASRGVKVVLHDVGADGDGMGSDAGVAERAAAAIRDQGYYAKAESGPIETRAHCLRLVETVSAGYGRLDILIHNAGWVGYRPIEQLDEAFLGRMTSLGINATLWLAQAAWPVMSRQNHGRMLFTTSDRALYPEYAQSGLAAYAAVKMAIIGMTNILALEGRKHGILVNAISPVAKTRMWGVSGEPDELHPDSVAPGAAYLVSGACHDSGWILRASNGQYRAIRMREAEGVEYPRNLHAVTAATPEDIAAQWDRIALERPETR